MHSRPSEKLLFIRMSIQNKEMVGPALSRQDMSAFPCFTVFLGGKIYLSPMMSTSAAVILSRLIGISCSNQSYQRTACYTLKCITQRFLDWLHLLHT